MWPSLPRTHSINPDARRSVQPFQNAAVSTMLASRTGFVACQHGVAESLPRDMTAAAVVCGACGTELPPNSKFCNECGAPVATATTSAEYKQVTVLFAEVVIPLGAT